MLIHVRRPDGQNIDAILHANPAAGAAEKGLLFAFSPTNRPSTATVSVNLYYTGLEATATVTAGSADDLPSKAIYFTPYSHRCFRRLLSSHQ